MTLHVFIDTNVFLSFYSYNNDDIEELKKLTELIKAKKVQLYFLEQVAHELRRNRERKIQDALNTFKDFKADKAIPRFMLHFDGVKEYQQAAKALLAQHTKLLKEALHDAEKVSLPADKLIYDLTQVSPTLPLTEAIIKAAKWRAERGDPPGKPNSIGDALNWEHLLRVIPANVDMHIVSLDGDFFSILNRSAVHPVLEGEWSNGSRGKLFVHNQLGPFLKEHFPSINMAADIEKGQKIEALINSPSFASTHRAIADLVPYIPLFNEKDVEEIISAFINNNQIKSIGKDLDLNRFMIEMLEHKIPSSIKNETIEALGKICDVGFYKEEDDDDEWQVIPF